MDKYEQWAQELEQQPADDKYAAWAAELEEPKQDKEEGEGTLSKIGQAGKRVVQSVGVGTRHAAAGPADTNKAINKVYLLIPVYRKASPLGGWLSVMIITVVS